MKYYGDDNINNMTESGYLYDPIPITGLSANAHQTETVQKSDLYTDNY